MDDEDFCAATNHDNVAYTDFVHLRTRTMQKGLMASPNSTTTYTLARKCLTIRSKVFRRCVDRAYSFPLSFPVFGWRHDGTNMSPDGRRPKVNNAAARWKDSPFTIVSAKQGLVLLQNQL